MPSPAAPPRRSLLHHADFRRLWVGDALGQLGAQVTFVALPVYAVTHLGATEWQMGLLTATESAAFLVIGLPAGAWVDRMRKRRTLIVADLVRAAVLAVVVVAALTGHGSMPLLYACGLAISAATVFFDVAHQSYLPGLVGLDHLVEGNAKLQATGSVAAVVGPAVGGALLRVLSAPALVVATVVTYVASAVAVTRIRQDEPRPSREDRRPLRTEIAEGLRFVVHQPLLRRIVACTALSNLAGGLSNALLVLLVLRDLGLDEATLGLVLSAGAVGGVVGAVAAEWLGRALGEARVIPVSSVLTVPAYALAPLAGALGLTGAPAAGLLVVGGVVLNLTILVYNVAQVSFRQRLCPPALLGRMNASVRFLVWGTLPIGGVLGGWLGTSVGVVPALWVGTAVTAVATLPVLLSPLLGMRELPVPDAAGEPVRSVDVEPPAQTS